MHNCIGRDNVASCVATCIVRHRSHLLLHACGAQHHCIVRHQSQRTIADLARARGPTSEE